MNYIDQKIKELRELATPDEHGTHHQHWLLFPWNIEKEELPKDGYICKHDDSFLCEHRVEFLVAFLKQALEEKP